MNGYVTFRAWLLRHAEEASPLGELARSIAADRCAVYTGADGRALPIESQGNLRRHVRFTHTKDPEAMRAMHEAGEAWRAER